MSAFPSQDTGTHAHARSATFRFPLVPRYAEIDQQGVVFNSHYLIWFDEAFTAFMAHLGVPYPELIAGGCDVMLAHTELDYAAPVRWGDAVTVVVTADRVGTTSFTLRFGVHRSDAATTVEAVVGRTVYVCVDAREHTTRPVPDALAVALRTRVSDLHADPSHAGVPEGEYRDDDRGAARS